MAFVKRHGLVLAYVVLAVGAVLGIVRIEQVQHETNQAVAALERERVERVQQTDALVCSLVDYYRSLLGVVKARGLPGDDRLAAAVEGVIRTSRALAPSCYPGGATP